MMPIPPEPTNNNIFQTNITKIPKLPNSLLYNKAHNKRKIQKFSV